MDEDEEDKQEEAPSTGFKGNSRRKRWEKDSKEEEKEEEKDREMQDTSLLRSETFFMTSFPKASAKASPDWRLIG